MLIAESDINDSECHRNTIRVNCADADDSICNSHPLRDVAARPFARNSGFSLLKTLGGGR
jgi:hypothetical protein